MHFIYLFSGFVSNSHIC